jgi:hypothetical protein
VTGVLAPTSYTVDPWDPGYGVAYGDDLDGREPTARLDLAVELAPESWRAVWPACGAVPSSVLFLDGVRRIDARVWVHGPAPQPVPAVAASLAAGLVRCDGAARIADIRVDRSLYTTAASVPDLVTRHATYAIRLVSPPAARRAAAAAAASADAPAGAAADVLSLAVQRRLAELETEVAATWQPGNSAGSLLVVDGPLRAHATHVTHAVGYVKTHHVPYLPPPQAAVIAAMAPGQRSPVFAMTTSWPRHSWYLRLAGGSAAPWSGVVRLECPTDLPPAEAIALADLTARVLPPLASTAHKDPRAPQNLVPIGGLERHLRHRLGDAALLYRSLRAAAHRNGVPSSTTIAAQIGL